MERIFLLFLRGQDAEPTLLSGLVQRPQAPFLAGAHSISSALHVLYTWGAPAGTRSCSGYPVGKRHPGCPPQSSF